MWSNLQIMFDVPVLTLGMVINGLMIGGIFALIAYGLALVWGVMNVKNLAQGDFVILGAYITWWLYGHGLNPVVGIPIASACLWIVGGGLYLVDIRKVVFRSNTTACVVFALVTSIAAGLYTSIDPGAQTAGFWSWFKDFLRGFSIVLSLNFLIFGGIYGFVIRRVIEHDLFTSLLATFGVGLVLQQSMKLVFGADEQTIALNLESFGFFDNLLTIQPTRLIAFIASIILAIAVITFMKRSRMGQAIRATAQNPRAARVMGIDTEKVYAFTFSLNAAICGAAGGLIALIWEFQPFIGLIYSIRAFVIVTAAGLGNLAAVIAAGLGMGVIEQTGAFVFGTEYQQAIVVGLLIVVLLIKLILVSRTRGVVE